MHANRNLDQTINRSQFPKSPPNQRLNRPGDLKIMQLLSAYPDNKIKLLNGLTMIPIPAEDAKALGLRVPDSDSFKSNSTSFKGPARLSSPKSSRKRSNDDSKLKKDVKRHRNMDVKTSKKLPDLKQEQKAQRTATLETLSILHAKLERGLKNISNRTKARPKFHPDTPRDSDTPANSSPTTIRTSGRKSTIGGKLRKKSSTSQGNKPDKLRKESSSKSTKQLFSMAESWSSDSVVSHSDNCACCHSREPCPFHGSDFYGK
ncbi:uncharacterized protein LOC105667133 [Bombus terrestris]|uniref:Uncharacterized protein LOC105667133 n=1 Tax=Bombus terrestris TaxID=30195 RepID=A0A9C6S2S5_BOMTE|nr:uncharacterized protein LOC105667133 [Bombus terrestris]